MTWRLVVAQHGDGRSLEHKPGAFLAGIFILMAAAGHVRFVAPIDADGLAGAVTDGGAEAIHSRVAGAHDQYALAGNLDGGQFQRHGGGLLEDEGQGLDDALQVRAGNLQRPGLAGIEAEEDGVEPGAQLSEGEVLLELDAQAEDDAALLENLNPALDDGALHLERGRAVHEEAAGHQRRVEDGDGIPAPGQFIGAGQTAGAGADHRDAQAVRRGGAGIDLPVGKGVFGEELLDGPNGHRLGHAVENAGPFAQAVGRANPGADFRHVGGGSQHGGGLQEAAFGGQQHPLRDGVAQGAAGHTARVWALDAAAGLLARSGFVVEAVDFEEIRHPFRSRALGQALVGQLAPRVLGIRLLRDCVAHRVTMRSKLSIAWISGAGKPLLWGDQRCLTWTKTTLAWKRVVPYLHRDEAYLAETERT